MENRKATAEPQQEGPYDNIIERRYYQSEARASKLDDGRMVIGGYGAIFNQYTNMGWYAEVVLPGFFDGIKDDRCACLFNHTENQILGRKKNGTLSLKVDANGLDYESKLPSHRADVYELVKDGYIYESSFAFTIADRSWAEVDRSLLTGKLSESDLDYLSYGGKIAVCYLKKGRELFDVSPVTYAAYEGTTTDTRIAKRSFDVWKAASQKETQSETDNQQQITNNQNRARLLEAIERSAK